MDLEILFSLIILPTFDKHLLREFIISFVKNKEIKTEIK